MKRRIIKIIIFMLAMILLCASTALAKQREFGQILSNDVNMRAIPSTDGDKIKSLPIGIEVEILELVEVKNEKTKNTEKWYRVICDGMTGYVRNDLVFVRQTKDRIAYALKDGANIRGGPGQSAYIIGKLAAGRPVRISMMVGEWYYVTYDGKAGFVQKDLVQLTSQTGSGYDQLLRFDMSGQEVKRLQTELARRNFLEEKHITGTFGALTRDAVTQFQKAAELEPADGIAGPETIEMVYDQSNKIRKAPKIPSKPEDFKNNVIMIDWWKGGNKVLRRPGGVAKVTDVVTGKSFNIRRTAGTLHNDVVPQTAADTAIMRSIVGSWTWSRRAIWVTVGSKTYAGSMNCMPHSPDPQKNDNFPGHFCIHFLNSKTHGGNRVDPEHQAKIKYAYNKSK